MQASGRQHGMRSIAKILYKDEGLFRFWNGAQVIASGCVPAHASYFLMYEYLKKRLHVDNQEFSFGSTMLMGCATTFVHDFFITPADGKWNLLSPSLYDSHLIVKKTVYDCCYVVL